MTFSHLKTKNRQKRQKQVLQALRQSKQYPFLLRALDADEIVPWGSHYVSVLLRCEKQNFQAYIPAKLATTLESKKSPPNSLVKKGEDGISRKEGRSRAAHRMRSSRIEIAGAKRLQYSWERASEPAETKERNRINTQERCSD
jgi:hypothetical protein